MERFKKFVAGDNLPRFIISGFFLLILLTAVYLKMPFGRMMSDIFIRFGMNGVLVLAMVPAIQSGIRPNFGLPIGIIGGLLGIVISMEFNFTGFVGLLVAIVVGVFFGVIFGWLYGLLLNRVKGSEMIIATYTGFSFVALMCIAWLVLPFTNDSMKWPIGSGLKNTITMESSFGELLNNFLSFRRVVVGGDQVNWVFNESTAYLQEEFGKDYFVSFHFPTGMILFVLLACFLVYLFINSRTGIALRAVGDNSRFAEASGLNVDRSRLIGTILSTVLGAVGIIIYSQGFGYMQLYLAPQYMAFPAVAAILIGGASATRARISHVLIGTFLFNGLLTIGLPVANALVPDGGLSEVFRMIIQNGVILYALTKVGGSGSE
ncbi:MAG: ABC transporter permease [Eubacteriales bacterium]|nr:ABC transporter permease [Eubacteriales bacterium]